VLQRTVTGTGVDELLQSALHPLQFADALLDLAQSRLGPLLDGFHAALSVGGKCQQLADFFQCETEILGAADEAQALDHAGPVIAVAGRASLRLGQQPFALVIADRVDADPGAAGDGADGDMRFDLPVRRSIHAHSLNP